MRTPPKPPAEKCEFCGQERQCVDTGRRWPKGDIIWDPPEPCDCPGAVEHRLQLKEAERQQREEWERGRHISRVKSLLKESKLPPRYQQAAFENARRTDANKKAYARAFDYCKTIEASIADALDDSKYRYIGYDPEKIITVNRGLFITGPASSGKTHLAGCIVNTLLEREVRCLFGNVLDLLGRVKNTYNNDRAETEDQVIDDLTAVPMLIIDDLGKEKVGSWTEQLLYHIINHRYEHLRPLIVTSNFTLTELEGRYTETGPYIVSRLIEMCDGLKMTGDDWRKGRSR